MTKSQAFKKWTDDHPANWNLGAMWDDGKFIHFIDPETDNAWLGFSAAWNIQAAALPDAKGGE